MAKPHRNTPERIAKLAMRKIEQRTRPGTLAPDVPFVQPRASIPGGHRRSLKRETEQ
jgi:hypothetical protein